MSKHTNGVAFVAVIGKPYPETGVTDSWHVGFGALHTPNSATFTGTDAEGNAKRVRSCWNALVGVPDPEKAVQAAREAISESIAVAHAVIERYGLCHNCEFAGCAKCRANKSLAGLTAALALLTAPATPTEQAR